MIRVEGVTQHYGVRPVLRRIDIEIRSGELAAVLGPNGMGKSTLLGVIAGVLSPQKGQVEIDGLVRRSSPEDELAVRRRVAYLPDHPWLPLTRTGREFLLAVGQLYEVEVDRLIDHVDRLLELFDLVREGDWPIRSYSNGQKKKIALSGVLVSEAPVLLLDEPFSAGLDPSGLLALKRVLRRLVEEKGATVVMATPVPELVEELADRVAVLQDGRIRAFDTVEAIRRETGGTRSLAEAFEKLVHPETSGAVDRYFKEPPQ